MDQINYIGSVDRLLSVPLVSCLIVSSELNQKEAIHEITLKNTKNFGDISCCFVDRLMPA